MEKDDVILFGGEGTPGFVGDIEGGQRRGRVSEGKGSGMVINLIRGRVGSGVRGLGTFSEETQFTGGMSINAREFGGRRARQAR